MTGFLRWILGFVVALSCVLFALANRMPVFVVWSPFHDARALPLFLPVLCALFIGFVVGGALVWLNGAQSRKAERRQRKLIRALEQKLEDSEKDAEVASSLILLEERGE